MWKKFISDYLTFTKKDRAGIYGLLFLIGASLIIPMFFNGDDNIAKGDPEVENQIKALQIKDEESTKNFSDNKSSFGSPSRIELFYFDPNTNTLEDWKRLGLKEKTAQTILNYISKGGKFKSPSDLKKIYGLSAVDAERLIPFVRISQIKKEFSASQIPKTEYTLVSTKKVFEKIDINTADTTMFQSLPGIGSRLAVRIVNFRNKLGGFVSIDQVGETYFLPDTTFQKIKPYLFSNNFNPRVININTSDIEILKAHPYISYKIANAIIQYRKQHSGFKNLEELRRVHLINDSIYTKMAPYLTLE